MATEEEIDYEGHLELRRDPEAWIKNNPASRQFSVRSLEVSFYDGKEIGESIGELTHLIHLNFLWCYSLKCVPNTITRLHNLQHLEFIYCFSLEELPANVGCLVSLTHVKLSFCYKIKYLPETIADLSNLTSLSLEYCGSLVELPTNIGQLVSLTHLKLSDCNNIKYLPNSIVYLSNLTSLSLVNCDSLVELPPYLDGLAHLCVVDIQNSRIRCLPWSIIELCKLRHLLLPSDFRLETLPDKLNDSIIISVKWRHVRKSWEELKEEMRKLPIPVIEGIPNGSTQNLSIIYPPGYLRLKEDPSQWIINNTNLLMLVRFLDLEYVDELTDSMTQFSELTHLYLDITGDICLPDNYFVTMTRLRNLSLQFNEFVEIGDMSIFHRLSKLSDLESLHLISVGIKLPANMPDSLKHLSLTDCNMGLLYDSLEKLNNLKTLDLHYCYNCVSLPPNICPAKIRLVGCSFEPLPIGLLHLEISFIDLRCIYKKCYQLVNLRTLSITSFGMESLPEEIARLHNLQKLQLKDCVKLKELPSNLHELVNLHTLDISITRIKSLPPGFMKLPNLQHLILPKCFNLKSLPRNLKQVSVIDDTDEMYYKSKIYDASLYQASADTPDESEDKETEQGVVPQGYNSPKEMPDNIKVMNRRLKYYCSMQSPPRGLEKAEHLKISLCICSKELLEILKDSMSLQYLAIEDCSQHCVNRFPTNLSELANLKTLSIRCNHVDSLPSFVGLSSLLKLYVSSLDPISRFEKLPADLDKLDRLLVVDIHDTNIKCLPWRIKKLQKLRFLFLPLDFKLETLPSQLIESVVITVDSLHIRKTWKELKAELGVTDELPHHLWASIGSLVSIEGSCLRGMPVVPHSTLPPKELYFA